MAAALHPFPKDGGTNSSQIPYSRTIMPAVDGDSRYPSKTLPSNPQYSLQRTSLSYAQPPPTTRRVFERYSVDEANNGGDANPDAGNSPRSTLPAMVQEAQPTFFDSNEAHSQPDIAQVRRQKSVKTWDNTSSTRPSSPRHPAVQSPAFLAALAPSMEPLPSGTIPPVVPLTASPTYTPPISPRHRAYPQQPTFIIPPATPNPADAPLPVPPQQQQEEVCVECAMRDQEMADVDVTSPGVWERESDALYEELKQREMEEGANRNTSIGSFRPRATGGRLTEQNLKLWLALNPREPASKQQTLHAYIKAQRALLEAEEVAHAQAIQEAEQFDNKVREAYTQLRQSTYDLTNGTIGADDFGGLRIKQPLSPTSVGLNPRHARSQSREVTLLENGMIVEHVDVRREEREERERRKKEEKRARKLSRSSALDMTSIISAPSNGQHTDSGLGLQPYSNYTLPNSKRPNSVLTVPSDRPDIPPAYSQASFSDVHSVGSTSLRRSRFLGFRNLTPGWRSRDSLAPSGVSGSMIDMHLALQREPNSPPGQPLELNIPHRSQTWSNTEVECTINSGRPEKKKIGLARIWRLVTGSGKSAVPGNGATSRPTDKLEDDFPLAPPPPLSYLVDRGNGDLLMTNGRHSSTPSLPSVGSMRLGGNSAGMSPPTPPSSVLPSPVSSRPYGGDVDNVEVRINYSGNSDDQDGQRHDENGKSKPFSLRKVYPAASSEPDIRGQVVSSPPPTLVPTNTQNKSSLLLLREKSLPPLPGEARSLVTAPATRPRTVYSDDPRNVRLGLLSPAASPGTYDVRRQSFSGITSRSNIQSTHMKLRDPQGSFGLQYDEFGASRRSLGRLEYTPKALMQPSTKRKSKFLTSLLGKKPNRDPQDVVPDSLQQFPPMRRSGSDGQDYFPANGHTLPTSRYGTSIMSGPSRPHHISFTSRKTLEELVTQDSDFVAYRYPSKGQHLDFLH